MGSGAELDPDVLDNQQICITLSNSNNIVVATVEAHCSGAISSSGLDEMDDCTVDLLLPPSVKWKCWRLANCTEYDEDAYDVSGVSGGGGAGGEGGSEGNGGDHCHDGETQELAEDASWSE